MADLNPRWGTEPGKVRPVVVVQTDMLNGVHPSTVVCPITTRVKKRAKLLRVHLRRGEAQLPRASDVMVDQIRAVDNRRLLQRLGGISRRSRAGLRQAISVLLS